MILYTKFSNDRRPELRICTDILRSDEDGTKAVRKRAADPAAIPHIAHIAAAGSALETFLEGTGFKVNRFERRGDELFFEYLEGTTLEEKADSLLADPDKAASFIMRFCEELRRTADTTFEMTGPFREVFGDETFPEGTPAVSVADIDLILSNVIDQDGWQIIDYEWTFFFPVPVDYLIWRVLNHYLDLTPGRRAAFKDKDIWNLCGISREAFRQYRRMEKAFQRYVDGSYVALRFLYEEFPSENIEARPPAFGGLLDALRAENESLRAALNERTAANKELEERYSHTKDRLRETIAAIAKSKAGMAAALPEKPGLLSRFKRGEGAEETAAAIRPLLNREDCKIYDSIDAVSYRREALVVRGWAYDMINAMESPVTVRDGLRPVPVRIRRFMRRDVSEVLGIERTALAGFVLECPLAGLKSDEITVEFENEKGYIAESIPIIRDSAARQLWNDEHADPVDVHETAGYRDWLEDKRQLRRASDPGAAGNLPYQPVISLCLCGAEDYDAAARDIQAALGREAYKKAVVCRGDTVGDLKSAEGDFVMMMRAGDSLEENALAEYVTYLNAHPDADMVYADEDRMTADGSGFEQPVYKPDYSPELIGSGDYFGGGLLIRKSLIDKTALSGDDSVKENRDRIVLACAEAAGSAGHIAQVLCHASPQAGAEEEKDPGSTEGTYRPFDGKPLVSIIIPNRDMAGELRRCLMSIVSKSTYRRFEVLIVENASVSDVIFSDYYEYTDKLKNVRVLTYRGAFNYAAINNFAAAEAEGDYLLFLNNDTEVITSEWIEELLSFCVRPDVGICGAKLIYPDGSLQHAGITVDQNGDMTCVGQYAEPGESGYLGRFVRTQDAAAVSGACMMIDKKLFASLGGFDERFTIAYNDIDLAMKARESGRRVIYNARCRLLHKFANSTSVYLGRGTPEYEAVLDREKELFAEKWKEELKEGDPFINRNLICLGSRFILKDQRAAAAQKDQ